MHFEFLLLDSLLSADSIVQWEKNLGHRLRGLHLYAYFINDIRITLRVLFTVKGKND